MIETLKKLMELRDTSSSISKQRIMRENRSDDDFKRMLYYALNPRLTYKVSEKTLREFCNHSVIGESNYEDVYELCEEFANKKALTDANLANAAIFLCQFDDFEREIYIKLLSKTLRLGVTGKTVNKIFPGLIPEWEVQQAYPVDKYPLRDGTWFAVTQKLNGVRATLCGGQLFARSGETFDGLEHIVAAFPEELRYTMVFDGELTIRPRSGINDNEAFRITTGLVNSESADKTEICFTVFDALPVNEFEAGESTASYRKRREMLDFLFAQASFGDSVSLLPVLYAGTDQTQIELLLNKMVSEDKEGLMVNLDTPYKCKRHSGILKVKRFYTMDLPIVRVEEGTGKYAGTTGALVVDYKGNEVGVGTGLTDGQRELFWRNQDQVVGMLIEVKYKEISYDKKTGAESLQFPVFVQLRPDKDQVSYG